MILTGAHRNQQGPGIVDRVPMAQAMKSLTISKAGDVQGENKMSECVICMEDYKDDDQIATINCSNKHYFHEACVVEWLKKN